MSSMIPQWIKDIEKVYPDAMVYPYREGVMAGLRIDGYRVHVRLVPPAPTITLSYADWTGNIIECALGDLADTIIRELQEAQARQPTRWIRCVKSAYPNAEWDLSSPPAVKVKVGTVSIVVDTATLDVAAYSDYCREPSKPLYTDNGGSIGYLHQAVYRAVSESARKEWKGPRYTITDPDDKGDRYVKTEGGRVFAMISPREPYRHGDSLVWIESCSIDSIGLWHGDGDTVSTEFDGVDRWIQGYISRRIRAAGGFEP